MARESEKYTITSIVKTYKHIGENARGFFNFKFYMLLGSLTLILMLVGAIGGPRRAFGRSRGALGAHLTLFDKYVKKCKTWIIMF